MQKYLYYIRIFAIAIFSLTHLVLDEGNLEVWRSCYICEHQGVQVHVVLIAPNWKGTGILNNAFFTNSIFFCFLFVSSSSGKHFFFRSSQLLPRLRLAPHNWQAFWADRAPFKGPRLASCIASGTRDIEGHSQVCRARRRGPRTPSRTRDANLDCAFVLCFPKLGRPRPPLASLSAPLQSDQELFAS